MRHIRFLFLVAAVLLGWATVARADDFSSTNFIVKDPVISGGGGFSTSNNFRLWSSVSQPAVGTSTATSFGIQSGFLYFPEPTPSPSPTPTPTPSPSPPGGAANSPEETRTLVEDFIRRLAGTRFPIPESPCGRRSDYNCDGKVDLQDLSIVLSRPPRPTLSLFSVLFSDWTARLPVLLPSRDSLEKRTEEKFTPPLINPVFEDSGGLAAVSDIIRASTSPSRGTSIGTFVRKIFTGIIDVASNIIIAIGRLFGIGR